MNRQPPRPLVASLALVIASACVFAATACSGKIEGLTEVTDPLLRIRVQTSGDITEFIGPDQKLEDLNLHAALVWAGVAKPPKPCIEMAQMLALGQDATITTVYEHGCKDVYGFVPKLVQAVAKVDNNGHADINLDHLPTAEVLVGPPGSRIAFGSIVIFDDRDDNGTLDLRRGKPAFRCRDYPPHEKVGNLPSCSGDPAKKKDDGGKGKGDAPKGPPDVVYGASFYTMAEPHVRLVYREGDFAVGSFFYPTLGCAAPPQGFSLMAVSGPPIKATCVNSKVSQGTVEIPLQTTETVAEVACRNQHFFYLDSSVHPFLDQPHGCYENALYAATPPKLCKGLSAVSLRGCRNDLDCDEPDWDDHQEPPKWWPCGPYVEPTDDKESAGKRGKERK